MTDRYPPCLGSFTAGERTSLSWRIRCPRCDTYHNRVVGGQHNGLLPLHGHRAKPKPRRVPEGQGVMPIAEA